MPDKNYTRFEAEISIDKDSIQPINPEISLCDITVMHAESNRNNTRISKESVMSALPTLYGAPIVAELIEKDDGSTSFGGHGGRIEITDDGIKYVSTVQAVGFITADAVRNATWEIRKEADGKTEHEYLVLKRCCLWTGRIPAVSTILSESYGQSMEISILETSPDVVDGCVEITKFIFSALCVLSGEHPPCFPQAEISRSYALDDLKQDIAKMLDTYTQYAESVEQINKGGKPVKDKIVTALSAYTIKNCMDVDVEMYMLLGCRDNEVDVISRDNYSVWTIPYTISEDGDGVTLNVDNKVAKAYGAIDMTEESVDMGAEVKSVADATAAFAVETFHSTVIDDLNQQLATAKSEYTALESEYKLAQAKLDEHAETEAKIAKEQHVAAVDAKFNEYGGALQHCSEYLLMRGTLDYTKSVEEYDVDLLLTLGKYKKKTETKGKFTYNPTVVPVADGESYKGDDRYGGILEKYANK